MTHFQGLISEDQDDITGINFESVTHYRIIKSHGLVEIFFIGGKSTKMSLVLFNTFRNKARIVETKNGGSNANNN